MKITGVLVDMLVQLKLELYGPYVVYENGHNVLYVQVLKPFMACCKPLYFGIRSFEMISRKRDLYSICMTHAMQTALLKRKNTQSDSMWMI